MKHAHNHLASVANPIASPLWFDGLVTETTVIENAGVHAAMLSVRLYATESPQRIASQGRTLFGRILRPTDRVEQTSPTTFSILLAPEPDLVGAVVHARAIADGLHSAGLRASTGFAQRRAGESLLDTWARAEAQLDRAVYRSEHQHGLAL
ncbi:MAG: hypothetical protein ACI81L_000030 [Verrucomicrobiales bacterium]|jgi:hypothetical protein